MTDHFYREVPSIKRIVSRETVFLRLCWLYLLAHVLLAIPQRMLDVIPQWHTSVELLPACASNLARDTDENFWPTFTRAISILSCVALLTARRSSVLPRVSIVFIALLLLIPLMFLLFFESRYLDWPYLKTHRVEIWVFLCILVWFVPFAYRYLRDGTIRQLAQLHGVGTLLYLGTPRTIVAIQQFRKPSVCGMTTNEMYLSLSALTIMSVAMLATLMCSIILKSEPLPADPPGKPWI